MRKDIADDGEEGDEANVQSDLLGFISLNAMGNYEHRSGEVSQ